MITITFDKAKAAKYWDTIKTSTVKAAQATKNATVTGLDKTRAKIHEATAPKK